MSLRVNLGCGKDVLPGFVNIDLYPNPGVVQADIEGHIPLKDDTAEYVLANNVLEHVVRFDLAWMEIHRVLKVGGLLEVRVPHGFNTDPYHIRFFDRRSIKHLVTVGTCGHEHGERWYSLVGKPRVRYSAGFPWWHVRRHLGVEPPALFGGRWLGWGRELVFTLRKVA